MRTLTGLDITLDLAAPADVLTDGQQTVVLRVMQEALQNVRKHAARDHRLGRPPGSTRTTAGRSRSATTAAGSTSARSRPAAGGTSGSNSCASVPS